MKTLLASQTPILSPDALDALGRKILSFTTADTTFIGVSHIACSVTRVYKGRVRSNSDGDNLQVSTLTRFGQKSTVWLQYNQIDDQSLRNVVAFAEQIAREQPGDPASHNMPHRPQKYLPQTVWHDNTVEALTASRHAAVSTVINAVDEAKLVGAAFVGVAARSVLYMDKDGLNVSGRATDSEITLTAWNTNRKGSGWAGQAARDWSKLNPADVAARCIEVTQRAANPVALEPGRRMAILGPAAVVQLVRMMAYAWDAYLTIELGGTPFWDPKTQSTRLGRKVFDERITITSDPNDPADGYLPFVDHDGRSGGLPLVPMAWVEHGILKHLAFGHGYAARRGVEPASDIPFSMRVGEGTTTMEDMIANCKEGIYVNRFSNLEVLDSTTGMMSGVTRDGCFLVKNGKITKSVKNFRFLDSPFLFLNNVEAIGMPARVALGYSPPGPGNPRSWETWPIQPLIVPPVMVRDFNFVALSDAV